MRKGWHHERYRHSLASKGIETRRVMVKTGDYPPTRKEMDIRYDPVKARVIIIRYMASNHYHDPKIPTKLKLEELLNRFSDDDVKDLIRLYYMDRGAFMQELGGLGYGKVRISGQAFVPDLEKQKIKAERKASAPEHQPFSSLSKTNQRKLKLLEKEEVPGALFQVVDIEKLWDESNFDGRNHLLHRASAAMKAKRQKYKKAEYKPTSQIEHIKEAKKHGYSWAEVKGWLIEKFGRNEAGLAKAKQIYDSTPYKPSRQLVTQQEKDAVSRAEDQADRRIYQAELQRIKDVEDKEDY